MNLIFLKSNRNTLTAKQEKKEKKKKGKYKACTAVSEAKYWENPALFLSLKAARDLTLSSSLPLR